jgi:hypothetical protein
VQVSVAVPVTVAPVLFTPVPTVIWRLAGAEAVMVAVPGILQVASPRLLIDATGMFDDDQLRPSPTVSSRLLPLLKLPVALKPVWPCELLGAVALAGVTVMLVMVGWPAPHPINKTKAVVKERRTKRNFSMKYLEGENLSGVAGYWQTLAANSFTETGIYSQHGYSVRTLRIAGQPGILSCGRRF